jgi:hypothetical protein
MTRPSSKPSTVRMLVATRGVGNLTDFTASPRDHTMIQGFLPLTATNRVFPTETYVESPPYPPGLGVGYVDSVLVPWPTEDCVFAGPESTRQAGVFVSFWRRILELQASQPALIKSLGAYVRVHMYAEHHCSGCMTEPPGAPHPPGRCG